MMASIPATGVNANKARFFQECASAFEFLALFHSLPIAEQERLMEDIQSRYAAVYAAKQRQEPMRSGGGNA